MKNLFKIEIIVSLLAFGVLLLIVSFTNTTGEGGDSIVHYLYSHYSFEYPEFFLRHWAKPVFVLLSSPFAQFGFKGIIVFNSICATLTGLFSYYIVRHLKVKPSWFVFLTLFFAPLYFKLIFSGLTEYLFGLFLVIGIYLVCKSQYTFASIILSFLPLIRSEGLIILGVFGLFFLIQKKYKSLPYLLLGQAIYTVIGASYYRDVFWVFNKIPYAKMSSPYGSGKLLDFVHRLNFVIEKPIYFLLVVGSVSLIYALIRKGLKEDISIKVVLIFGSFSSIFVAHTFFWWLGIFNSMGLPRVLNAVMPMIAIIALIGFQTILSWFKNPKVKNGVIAVMAALVTGFPFTNRPQGVVFNDKMFVVEKHRLIDEEVVPYLNETFPDYSSHTLYYGHPYLSLALNVDHFNPEKHSEMNYLRHDKAVNGSLIIWDNWSSVTQGGVSFERLMNDTTNLELVQTFKRKENKRTIQFSVFKTKVD